MEKPLLKTKKTGRTALICIFGEYVVRIGLMGKLSESYIVTGFDISDVEPSGSLTRESDFEKHYER
jgi:hypothetical protein